MVANTARAPKLATATAPVAPVATTPPATPVAVATPTAAIVDLSTLDLVGNGMGYAPYAGTPAPKAPKTPGVAPNARTRAYFAGIVLANHGHTAGVTPGMVAAVCALYGAPNKIESEICLRNAWHAVRGFMATAGVALPPAAPGKMP